MRRTRALVVCLLGLASLGLQSPPPGKPARPAPPPPLLTGTVTGPDGKPVANALVVAKADAGRSQDLPVTTRTDAGGAFRLAVALPVPHTVRIEAQGLAARTIERARPGSALKIALARGAGIEGIVRDGETGRPMPDVRIEARDRSARVGSPWDAASGAVAGATDAKGQFRIEGLGAGAHEITATKKGHSRAVRTVAAGGRVELYLFSGASISGSVIGPDGRAVEGAVLTLSAHRAAAPVFLRAGSDAHGRFDLLGLEPGTYDMTARHRDFPPAVVSNIYVEKGAQVGADVVFSAPARVLGRLVDATGDPVRGRITVDEIDGQDVDGVVAELLRAEAGANGRFRIERVPAGSHTYTVIAPGFGAKRVEVEVGARGGDVDAGDIVLEAGLAIRGSVRDKAGQPIAYAQVNARASGPNVDFDLVEATTEADGSFALGGLARGQYAVGVLALGYGQLTRDVEAGATGLDLVLSPAGTITGFVVDDADRPVDAFRVMVRPARRDAQRMLFVGRSFALGVDGRFTIGELADGAYIVEIAGEERASELLTDVKVTAGETADVGRIRLRAGGVIRGTVVDASGSGVMGASLRASSRGTAGEARSVSGAGGTFELKGVSTGVNEITATHPNLATAQATVDVDPAKGAAEARLVMSQGGRIEGTARRRDGSAIPDVLLQLTTNRRFGFDRTIPLRPDGTFVIEHVPAGTATVYLQSRSFDRRAPLRRKEVTVVEGETAVVEFQSREIRLSGQVTHRGAPAARYRIRLMGFGPGAIDSGSFYKGADTAAAGPERLAAVTRDDGSYEMLVDEPGRYSVYVEAREGAGAFPRRDVDVPDVEAHTANLSFDTVAIAGVVIDAATGAPVKDARIHAFPTKPTALRPSVGTANVDHEGRFTLELEPGEYKVSAHSSSYASQETQVQVDRVPIRNLRLQLSKGLTISGRVTDRQGKPVRLARIEAAGEPGADRRFHSASTDPDGSFEIAGLEPGTYQLFARAEITGFALRPDVAADSKGVAIALQPGGRVRVEVRNADGAPVEDAMVDAQPEGWNRLTFSDKRTDANGVVEIEAIAGPVSIHVRKAGLQGTARLAVTPGALVAVEVQMEPSRTLKAPRRETRP